jgi:small subunit ribosomal protein S4
VQLREKQKVKRYYGLVERQFRFLFSKADRMKGVTGENLLQLLERRLDNVVFRMGFASSRSEARQMVLHGHFAVNGRKVAVPSFCVKAGMEVAVREVRKDHKLLAARAEAGVGREPPKWLEVNLKEMKGKVVAMPAREDIDLPIQENLIVELYSK